LDVTNKPTAVAVNGQCQQMSAVQHLKFGQVVVVALE
jgi:hypothetical protein